MTTDILIQAIKDAFERAVHAAVDARMTGILQQYANTTGQFNADIDALKQRVAALELRMPLNTDANKVRELIDMKIEEALDAHANTYDHDSYDNVVSDLSDVDLGNIVSNYDLEEEVRRVLRNATVSLDF